MGKIYSEDELLAISGLQHIAFCERQWALIHIEKQWEEDQRTAEGRVLHERVHDPDYKAHKPGIINVRAMVLRSFALGLYGEADMVEFIKQPEEIGVKLAKRKGYYLPRPVEYKRGRPKRGDFDRIQLCAQAMCLEEMLECRLFEGDLYYGEIRRRETVQFKEPLRNKVQELSERMQRLYQQGITPSPAMKTSVCKNCSMQNICLPSIRNKKSVRDYWDKTINLKV
ncbi:MAG: CRISPR-associated protein Cas4 [Syntrophomonadaceae bacterium]|jgi:CRISPR-associated exonuclease Cas4|nr:CRISPR-associated protein Cas4 [Syntrophomonadaceae bacterium]